MARSTSKSSTTTSRALREPIHPGEFLADELEEIGVSAAELARLLRVPANRVSQIVAGKRAVSADTALRLGRYFGTGPNLWLNLQKAYELDLAQQTIGHEINRIPTRAE
jgi:antitoxin HigA-1